MNLPNRYDPKQSEPKWQAYWEKSSLYKFDPKSKKPIFSIDTPPPTVSGSMHMGHIFSYSQADFIARFWRMRGHSVFYPFGFDDNGLPTERYVEKLNNVKAADMARSEFQKLCLQATKKAEGDFKDLWTKVAISCDWSLEYSTIDERSQRASQASFIELYKKGRAYQKTAPVPWCTECQTAIAQVEQEDKQKTTQLIYIDIPVGRGKITIATTRPELMPACVSIFVHPKDKRYRSLIGKHASLPIFSRQVQIRADETVDMQYGTGAVYCCTFGDTADIEWVEKYKLKAIGIIGKDGRLNKNAGPYESLYPNQARKKIIEDLTRLGVVSKTEQKTHTVNIHERCQHEVEYIMAKQWYIRYLDLKDDFLKAGEKLNWHPQFMKHRYDNWVKGLKWDWCISRQRYFGVPFPVWYDESGKVVLPEQGQLPVDPLKDKPKGHKGKLTPETDILDTWATSSLTPQINARWLEDESFFKKLFPMTLRPQAHDIITFWLFNTVVKAYLHNSSLPWSDIMISGYVMDPKGQKMSKSKGNVVEPLTELQKHSADALRFWAASSKLGSDLPYSDKEMIEAGRFMTKLWNASRFAIMKLGDFAPSKSSPSNPVDTWLLSRLNDIISTATQSLETYEYSKAKDEVAQFFWHTLCDDYLEMVKYRIEKDPSAQNTLYATLYASLRLLAPFLPHITEEIYQLFFSKFEPHKSIHISNWPSEIKLKTSKAELETVEKAVDLIHSLRKYKAQNQLPMNSPIQKLTLTDTSLKPLESDISGTMNVQQIVYSKAAKQKTEKFSVEFGI